MIRRLLLAAVTVGALAGCSSGSDGTAAPEDAASEAAAASPATASPATVPSGGGGLGGAIEVAAGAPAAADASACGLERDVMASAIEMYRALVGTPPASEDDLMTEGLLVEPSVRFDVGADGTLVPAAGSPCS